MSDVAVEVEWEGDLRFAATGASGSAVTLDGNRTAGPSPMEALLLGLATCMAADVAEILTKMRVPFSGLAVRAEGDRRPEPPRYYTAIRLIYETEGLPGSDAEKLQRAVDLSREKYCSVLHTLRPDVDVSVRVDPR